MNEVKEENIPVIENSLCKVPEVGKSMESLRKVRVAAVQRARGTGPHEAREIVTTVYNWDSVSQGPEQCVCMHICAYCVHKSVFACCFTLTLSLLFEGKDLGRDQNGQSSSSGEYLRA